MEQQQSKIIDGNLHSELINTLAARTRGLEAVKVSQDEPKGRVVVVGGCMDAGGGGGAGGETVVMERRGKEEGEGEENVWSWCKVLESMRELARFHLDRVTLWREVVKKWECSAAHWPREGSVDRHAGRGQDPVDVSLTTIFQSVSEEISLIINIMNSITTRLDEEMSQLCSSCSDTRSQKPTEADPALLETGQSHTPSPPDDLHLTSSDLSMFDTVGDETESGQPDLNTTTDSDEMLCSAQQEVRGQHADNDCASLETDGGASDKDSNKEAGANLKWRTVGLTGHVDSGVSSIPDVCYIRAPAEVSQSFHCEVTEALSCLMVTGSEELVSRVIRLKLQDGARVSFPIAVVIPFYTRYRGNYRDIAVKVMDVERRASYICPISTEGNYGGQRGSFAEVRVYSLGLFAVVSCLKRENYTVPRKGLCLKLPMDPRICLTYLPGSFTAPVMAQAMIQPLDAVLLSAVKSRSDDYRAVVSTSPLLYLTHPSCQPLRRALTVTLPCAPKPKKKTRALEEMVHDYSQHITTESKWDSSSCTVRMLPACAKSTKEIHKDFLVLLGHKEQQWSTLEKITVRNQQKGLVSFEVTENFDRL
ncbi:hypothetical protein WMY93_014469 [Mugilogobius chulae]|uniref:Death domain-containing protein 1 n=1 Tax=Mugilogobius chulae TaxID=88201 RepID=A0AAW0P6M6_9GOBI